MGAAVAMISWMQSLSDLTRTRLLRLLDRHELTVMELCSIIQLPQSTVSRHLKTLSDDGWISARRDGSSNQYSLTQLEPSRVALWDLVKEQTTGDLIAAQDESRLQQTLVERSNRSQSFFSSAAERWDKLRNELFGSHLDTWALAALLPAEWTIADFGCGTGGLLSSIAPHVANVIGVDSSAAMLESARKHLQAHANVQLLQADLEQLPLKAGQIDAAILSIVLPYVASPEKVFAEASRVCRKGSRLIVIDLLPHQRVEFRQELNHTWLGFDREQIASWLSEGGWRMDTHRPLPPQAGAKGPNLFLSVATKI